METTLALDNFRRACDCGRGAVFFSVARGKVRRTRLAGRGRGAPIAGGRATCCCVTHAQRCARPPSTLRPRLRRASTSTATMAARW